MKISYLFTTEFIFLALAALTILSAIIALEVKGIVYGAFAVGVVFLGVAVLFILLDAKTVAGGQNTKGKIVAVS